MSITRYTPAPAASMEPSKDGGWVLYADYAYLVERAQRAESILRDAVDDFDNGIPASEDGDGMFFKNCGWVDDARHALITASLS